MPQPSVPCTHTLLHAFCAPRPPPPELSCLPCSMPASQMFPLRHALIHAFLPPSPPTCPQELEKFKFVLEYSIGELRAQLDPKEAQLAEMRDSLAVRPAALGRAWAEWRWCCMLLASMMRSRVELVEAAGSGAVGTAGCSQAALLRKRKAEGLFHVFMLQCSPVAGARTHLSRAASSVYPPHAARIHLPPNPHPPPNPCRAWRRSWLSWGATARRYPWKRRACGSGSWRCKRRLLASGGSSPRRAAASGGALCHRRACLARGCLLRRSATPSFLCH